MSLGVDLGEGVLVLALEVCAGVLTLDSSTVSDFTGARVFGCVNRGSIMIWVFCIAFCATACCSAIILA